MPIPFGSGEKPARAVYEDLASREREAFLVEARDVSAVTIPHLIPPVGWNASQRQRLKTPWQSLGARGVNNLASKLLLSLFPPNTSFFKLVVLEEKLAEAGATPDVKSEVEEALVAMESRVQDELELNTFRPRAFESFRHLIVAGNALMHVPDGKNWRVFHLDQYVVRRDPFDGKILLLVVKESVDRSLVSDMISPNTVRVQSDGHDAVDLYTAVWWNADEERYHSVQEISDLPLIDPDTGEPDEEEFKREEMPWLALRLTTDEDHYGRGVGADMLGDLVTSDSLSESIAEGAAIASRSVGLIKPGSTLTPATLNRTRNGQWTYGNPEDVKVITTEKARDFAFAFNALQDVNLRLSQGFLLSAGTTRRAERVTAEEIRFVARELEDVLGGVYSSMSQEFQLPLAKRMIAVLVRRKVLPDLPKDLVSPSVVTGLEALGRGQEFSRLRLFMQTAAEILGPQVVAQYTNPRETLSRVATSLSIDTLNLIRTEEEVQQAQRDAQRQALVETLGPQAIQAVGQNPDVLAAARGAASPQQ